MTPRRPYTRHGLNAVMTRVKLRGLHAIDRRMAAARTLFAWRQELVADLGGEAALSAQQRALIETAVRTRLFLEHLDAWLLGQPSLINARRRSVLPVFRERLQLADALGRQLQAFGLERHQAKPADLGYYLARYRPPTDNGQSAGAVAASQAGDRMTVVRRGDRIRRAIELHEWVQGHRLAVLEVAPPQRGCGRHEGYRLQVAQPIRKGRAWSPRRPSRPC